MKPGYDRQCVYNYIPQTLNQALTSFQLKQLLHWHGGNAVPKAVTLFIMVIRQMEKYVF